MLIFSSVPQGTELGPWLFILMINDLHPPHHGRYIDDTTLSEIIKQDSLSITSKIQSTTFKKHRGQRNVMRIPEISKKRGKTYSKLIS